MYNIYDININININTSTSNRREINACFAITVIIISKRKNKILKVLEKINK